MLKYFPGICMLVVSVAAFSQKDQVLTVEKIMRDPKWIGTSPTNPYWSADGKYLLFSWNPENAVSDSVYYVTANDLTPRKTTYSFRQQLTPASGIIYNTNRTSYSYAREGDIYFIDIKTKRERRVTETAEPESNMGFMMNDTRIAFVRNQNVFAWEITTGLTTQLTNFQRAGTAATASVSANLPRTGAGTGEETSRTGNPQEKWLATEQLQTSEVLKTRKQKRDLAAAAAKDFAKHKQLRTIMLDSRVLSNIVVSPDARFITYRLYKPDSNAKTTIIPNYVTESGFTTDIPGRTKVGNPGGIYQSYIFDTRKDTVLELKLADIPGITDLPDYLKDYPSRDSTKKKTTPRQVFVNGPFWNATATNAVVDIYSQDNKDRWLMLLDAETGKLKLLDRQRDEAWIGGPGISGVVPNTENWIDENTYWYQSETTGYSHLYLVHVKTGAKTALTSGRYEVRDV
ncbi:MAG TPA: DPP IV N-terminal domain-containing protein, partial [Chitinophagaceae bacterium]|nr:DPP IV N-terminal domain-containing protein [Chitinophagaceae bacterium]